MKKIKTIFFIGLLVGEFAVGHGNYVSDDCSGYLAFNRMTYGTIEPQYISEYGLDTPVKEYRFKEQVIYRAWLRQHYEEIGDTIRSLGDVDQNFLDLLSFESMGAKFRHLFYRQLSGLLKYERTYREASRAEVKEAFIGARAEVAGVLATGNVTTLEARGSFGMCQDVTRAEVMEIVNQWGPFLETLPESFVNIGFEAFNFADFISSKEHPPDNVTAAILFYLNAMLDRKK